MFRPSMLQTPTFKMILGLGLCSVGGAMLYAYFRMKDDDDDANEKPDQTLQLFGDKKKITKMVTVTFPVKGENITLLIGRDGQNVARIEEKTNTKIQFRDKDNTHKYCDIEGYTPDVKIARDLIFKEIARCSIVVEHIDVPISLINKIVGRGCEFLHEVSRKSLAKVSFDPDTSTTTNETRRLLIVGNTHQCIIARKLIDDKIQEEEDLRKAVEEVESTREPRRSPTNSLHSSLYSSQTSLSSHLAPKDKMISYSNDNKTMEVYVSAVATPSKFWIQLVGPQTKKLDSLVKEMTEYYNDEENRKMHTIREPYIGQIVAAIYCYDKKWYRAEIVGILPNEIKNGGLILDLYFVDYGDCEYVSTTDIYELRTDFLTLRFQAVECFLANIKPASLDKRDFWAKDAIEKFEELTEVACWKKLIARVVTYKDRPRTGEASSRDASAVPGIELFDTVDGVDINVANYLVSSGYALPLEGSLLESAIRSNSNTPTNTPSQSPAQSPVPQPLSPVTPPPSSSSSSAITDNGNNHSSQISAEDAHMQSQLKHLAKKSHNNQTNNNNNDTTTTAEDARLFNENFTKIKPNDLVNGNYKSSSTTLDAVTMPIKNLNGSLIS